MMLDISGTFGHPPFEGSSDANGASHAPTSASLLIPSSGFNGELPASLPSAASIQHFTQHLELVLRACPIPESAQLSMQPGSMCFSTTECQAFKWQSRVMVFSTLRSRHEHGLSSCVHFPKVVGEYHKPPNFSAEFPFQQTEEGFVRFLWGQNWPIPLGPKKFVVFSNPTWTEQS